MKKITFFFLMFTSVLTFAQNNSWEYRSGIASRANITTLNLFINIIYDIHPESNNIFTATDWPEVDDPTLEGVNNAAIPNYLEHFFDQQYDANNLRGTFTRLYGESSFDSLQITGDFVVVNVRESRIIQSYQIFNCTNIVKTSIDIINETGGLQTIYGHNNISDYDYDNSNRIYFSNVLIRNITREYGGINPGSGYGYSLISSLLINDIFVSGYKGTCQCVGSGDISANPTSILSHEISHCLFGSNNFHASGGNHRKPGSGSMPFLNIQGGYGLMGAANSGLVGCNGYERWRMHWKHPQAPNYITARNTENTEYILSDISKEDGNISLLLRDFVTYGDVVRIKLPYKDTENSDNQYIWLENHQIGRNGKLDFLQYSNEFECRPTGTPGIYAYYQIGRDMLSGTYSQVWDQINRDNLKILPAEGYWDYTLQRESEPYTLNCVSYDTKSYSIRREQPNALNGYQDQEFKILPEDEDNALYLSAEYPMLRKIVGDEVFDNLPSLGDNLDAFSTHSKISMGTNPSTCNRATCHSDNNSGAPTSIITTSNSQYDTKAIYLSGLSIEMTPLVGGDFRVDVRWDDYDISNDARWTGTIVLNEQANLKNESILTLAQNRTVSQTTRDSETGLFAPKTTLTCKEGSFFRQEGTSQLLLTENSELILESGSNYSIADNAKLIVGKGCRLLVETGASTSILNSGQLIIDSGAVATIYDTLKMGTNANLVVRPGGRLVVDGGTLPVKTLCAAPDNLYNTTRSISTRNEETFLPFFADLPRFYDIVHPLNCYTPDYNPNLLGCCYTLSYPIDSNDTRTYENGKTYFKMGYYYVREDQQNGHIFQN